MGEKRNDTYTEVLRRKCIKPSSAEVDEMKKRRKQGKKKRKLKK